MFPVCFGVHPSLQLSVFDLPWTPRPKAHGCRESLPVLGFNLLEFFFDRAVDFGRFFAKVPEFAKSGHPRLAARVVGPKLISDGLGN